MSKKKSLANSIALILSLSLFVGCGTADTVSIELFTQSPSEETGMLESAETDYEVPTVLPGISVDLYAYDTEADKKAILKGETLPASFDVCALDTGEVVLSGRVKRKEADSDDGLETAEADFSDLKTPGKYYIKTEILGKSKTFEIKDKAYDAEYEKAFEALKALECSDCPVYVSFESDETKKLEVSGGWHTSKYGDRDVVEGCLAVMDICTVYEYYPEIFEDALKEASKEIDWLFKMQNAETGGVYTSVAHKEAGNADSKLVVGGETTRATAYYCACMAKYSVTAAKINQEKAAKALQQAVKAWNCLEANKEIISDDQMYRAAVEMYRATGLSVYNNVILEYLKENADKEYEGRLALDAAITYLDSQRATNVDYDTVLMANYMSRIQDRNDAAEADRYCVDEGEYTSDDYLRHVYEFIVADYIMSSLSYVSLEEDYLHYLNGRNAESVNFADSLITPDSYVKLMALCGRLSYE